MTFSYAYLSDFLYMMFLVFLTFILTTEHMFYICLLCFKNLYKLLNLQLLYIDYWEIKKGQPSYIDSCPYLYNWYSFFYSINFFTILCIFFLLHMYTVIPIITTCNLQNILIIINCWKSIYILFTSYISMWRRIVTLPHLLCQ